MIETERLIISKLTPDDLTWLVEMRSPDAVNRYLGGPTMQNLEALTKRLQFYIDSYEKLGFGFCKMQLKSTGEAIYFIRDLRDPFFRQVYGERSMYLSR